MTSSSVPSLTGLRAFAALLVYIHHYNPFPESSFLYQLAREGYVGVTVFFVLSGFLITWNYVDKLSATAQRQRFYLLRFARIMPLYWLLLTGLYGLQWFTKGNETASFFAQFSNFLFLKGLISSLVFSGIPQSWSLSVELCFYLLAPWWISLVARRRWLVLALLYSSFILGLFVLYKNHLSFGSFYTIFGRFFEFGVGIYAALWLRKNQSPPVFRFKTIIAVGGVIGVVIGYVLAVYYGQFSVFYTEWLLYNLLLPGVLGFGLVGLSTEKTFINRVLSYSFTQTLGKSSYAFYLIHIGPVAVVLQRYVSNNGLLLLILLWIVAYGLYRWVERPLYFLIIDAKAQRS
ncbi:acyltransferase family protein [Runella sp. CRIBMP]|uniref:acyltransferase family protein n=1 Tax=Runella sp. CRIBMP TaxID=2683261 RepID=UPI001411BF13|nr:acyltransferase [Runella sp. CRIBMP]NBB21768.1 acyltransferase family protein [Runella sp. CRIBMP]